MCYLQSKTCSNKNINCFQQISALCMKLKTEFRYYGEIILPPLSVDTGLIVPGLNHSASLLRGSASRSVRRTVYFLPPTLMFKTSSTCRLAILNAYFQQMFPVNNRPFFSKKNLNLMLLLMKCLTFAVL